MALQADWCEVLRSHRQRPQPKNGGYIDWDDDEIIPEFPPATEEQVRLTEERLGFELPPTLRRLYLEVANGGDIFRGFIGPRVLGVIGGYPTEPNPWGEKTIAQMVSHSGWRLNERVDNTLQRYPGCYVLCEEAPDRFVTIAGDCWGRDTESRITLDGWTGRLYEVGNDFESVDGYRASLGLPITPDTVNGSMQSISYYASSVEAWIEGLITERPGLITSPIHGYGPITQAMLRNSGQ
jgi:hypothetical protein